MRLLGAWDWGLVVSPNPHPISAFLTPVRFAHSRRKGNSFIVKTKEKGFLCDLCAFALKRFLVLHISKTNCALSSLHGMKSVRGQRMNQTDDATYMREAIAEAQLARAKGEVPIGAVVVKQGQIIGRGHNLRETSNDPTSHAEMVAINQAAAAIDHWRLLETTLYVTLEPFVMCMGAIILAPIPRLVYACRDPRAGAAGSIYDFARDERFNHRVEVAEGVLGDECSAMLSGFFQELRAGRKAAKPPSATGG